MTAEFKAEGYGFVDDGQDSATKMVPVYMETDGHYVTVSRSSFWPGHRDGPPSLTPQGWQEVAKHALALVQQARQAWFYMQAECEWKDLLLLPDPPRSNP